jgi:hypothetical protein
MEILGYKVKFNLVKTGFLLGVMSSVLIFYIEISLARNFLGLLIGIGFSPIFTTERTDSNKYFFLAAVFIFFALLVLAGFRFPLVISFFVLAISAHGEFESRGRIEKIRNNEEEN